jgi:phosphoglycolate phosphatase-like HAD superfamily hydrolase
MNDPFFLVYGAHVLPTLVLDFDGTVCLGDAPVRCYAAEVLRHVEPGRAGELAEELRRHLDGEPGTPAYADGYVAVAQIAGPHVAPEVLHTAYQASRGALAGRALDIATPAGLPGFLAALDGRARRVLVTNAPATGIAESLDVLGLTDVIDEVRTNAGKPAGFAALLPDLLRGAPPETLMSVGDIWVNDIAPALAQGCATAFVTGARHDVERPAHLRADHLPDLYAAIAAWVDDPAELPRPSSLSQATAPLEPQR